MGENKFIVILGPTASGKTALAAHFAYRTGGEVISADSRQVYRGMDIGTGKDIQDYIVNGVQVPVHLIDIADPGEEYNLFRYQRDFGDALDEICHRSKLPILCGGTAMYLHAILKEYQMKEIPENPVLREELSEKDMDGLRAILFDLKAPHNTTDLEDRDRLIRAIEIAMGRKEGTYKEQPWRHYKRQVFGIHFDRDVTRKRITARLEQRLQEGMIDEVNRLLDSGLEPSQLEFYGLEYRYVTWFLTGKMNYQEMFEKLNTAIHQFSKRQMTWFRKMEREGVEIKWIDGMLPLESKVQIILNRVKKN